MHEARVPGLVERLLFMGGSNLYQGGGQHSYAAPASVALGVGIALIVGAAGLYYVQGRLPFQKPPRRPLSSAEWSAAFAAKDGRIIDGGKQVLERVREGGVSAGLRKEVWPFLLGLVDPNSTEHEQQEQLQKRRQRFQELRKAALDLAEKSQQLEADEELEAEGKKFRLAEPLCETEPVEKPELPVLPTRVAAEGAAEAGESEEVLLGPGERDLSPSSSPSRKAGKRRRKRDRKKAGKDEEAQGRSSVVKHEFATGATGENGIGSSEGPVVASSSEAAQSAKASLAKCASPKAMEDFMTWRRIIRLDAVRMNAAWVPYAPEQAAVEAEAAERLATAVGLAEDEHLEPSRRAHAARLTALLEAYAVLDQETGYCQGMSDLLSPFVALMDDDAEAFWCFERLMRTARHNFRLDEVGIRRQLNRLAAILGAVDPPLYKHLTAIGAGECIFAYRMVVVLLRRELSFEQTITLWEVVWADAAVARESQTESVSQQGETSRLLGKGGDGSGSRRKGSATEELLIFVIAAMVRHRRKIILEECTAMDEVLKECNSLAGHVDLWRELDEARRLVTLTRKSGAG